MNRRENGERPVARMFGAGVIAGAILLGAFCLLEWLVLFVRLPVLWSSGVVSLVLRNALMYAAAGAVAGAAVGVCLVVVRLLPAARRLSRASTAWTLLLAGLTAFYWVHAINVLYPGGAREAASLAMDAAALVAGVLLAVLLLRRSLSGAGGRRFAATAAAVVLVLWLPFYVAVSGHAGERISGGPDVGRVRAERTADPSRPNVLVIMLDTVRTDCMGCYCPGAGVTPNIDRLAGQSLLFEQAVTPEPLTRPAVSSMLTGLYPRSHGVDTNTKTLDASFRTLPEALRDSGYVTGGFMAASVLSGYYGTDQGFDTYTEPTEATWELSGLLALKRLYVSVFAHSRWSVEIPADEVTRRASEWIRANSDRPFFAFVHYFDPHFPYEPPPEHDPARKKGLAGIPVPYAHPQDRFRQGFEMPGDFLEMMWLKYRGEIAAADAGVGRLLAALDDLGLEDETVVVLLSDHGESFEKGFYFAHGNRLFDSLVHVALMFRYPGRIGPGRSPHQVGLLDLYPTLCALLEIPLEGEVQGKSILPAAVGAGAPAPQPVFMQTDFENPKPFSSRVSLGVRLHPWKYVESPELDLVELYDLSADPGELQNVVAGRPDVAAGLASMLELWLMRTEPRVTGDAELSPERVEALRALGYVQ